MEWLENWTQFFCVTPHAGDPPSYTPCTPVFIPLFLPPSTRNRNSYVDVYPSLLQLWDVTFRRILRSIACAPNCASTFSSHSHSFRLLRSCLAYRSRQNRFTSRFSADFIFIVIIAIIAIIAITVICNTQSFDNLIVTNPRLRYYLFFISVPVIFVRVY